MKSSKNTRKKINKKILFHIRNINENIKKSKERVFIQNYTKYNRDQ